MSFYYARSEYVCLTRDKYQKMEKENRLSELTDLERRKKYLDMPYRVQESTIKESIGNIKFAQTNFEQGHNRGYEVGGRDGSRRWKTLNFTAEGMRLQLKSVGVTMYPTSNFVVKGGDRGLYLKDCVIRFLVRRWSWARQGERGGYQQLQVETVMRDKLEKQDEEWWTALAPKVNTLLDKITKNGGHSFRIRYDPFERKWYLVLSHDAKVKGAPFSLVFWETCSIEQGRWQILQRPGSYVSTRYSIGTYSGGTWF
ncbi:hypothetical protein DFS34DRAFT_650962 [Phlyctochytrium arcticum]|nr:hypothetical protein DFS34DRAFT_650962 [Phlyctochytrium arcticum]